MDSCLVIFLLKLGPMFRDFYLKTKPEAYTLSQYSAGLLIPKILFQKGGMPLKELAQVVNLDIIELTLLKGHQRFDAILTSNLELYKF